MNGIPGLLLLACTLAPLCGAELQGQEVDSTAPGLLEAIAEAELHNRMVRFHSDTGAVAEGRLRWLVRDSVLQIGEARVELFRQRVLEVRFPRRDPLWNGMLIGAAAVTPVVYQLARIGNYLSEQPWDDRTRRDAIFAGVLSGIVIGGLVDLAKEPPGEWRKRWERQ